MDFKKTYQAYQNKVEEALFRYLPSRDTEPPRLHEAMHYSLAAGGKRLRPVLVCAAFDCYFTKERNPVPAAVAIEFLHTYSLIHDDLPSMDDSDLRRGRPSVHKAFDETTAILAGDALLTEAFHLLATAYAAHPEVAVSLCRILGEAAGSRKLIGGQAVDTLSENRDIEPETLDFIHQNKTAALITASLQMGLAIGDAPNSAFSVADALGRSLGLTFQIVDDILDATSTEDELGKSVGSDASNQKNTYVKVFGLEASREAAHLETQKALEACDNLSGADTRFLRALIQSLEFRVK